MLQISYRLLPCFVLLAVFSATAEAHFLFIRIGSQAEAGRAAEVYFSERATAGDPRFIEKVAHTQLWLQSAPGEIAPLEVRAASDRLRAALPSAGSISVIGRCEYGVLKRDVPFLLHYYPKAVSGKPDEINALKTYDRVPLEIVPAIRGDEISLQALREGKPVPRCTFISVDEDLDNEEIVADDSGRATFKPPHAGQFAVYVRHVIKEAGVHKGQNYVETREFATLSFEWPLSHTGGDAEAVQMFEKAIATRAVWRDFPGFTAEVAGSVDGRRFSGQVDVSADGSIKLKTDDEATESWVEDQLSSIVLHRQTPSGARSQPVLYFADQDERHPLGRLLTFVGGQFASSYRVRGDELIVVNRNLGEQNMTITVLENLKNTEGRYLPLAFTVQYWNAKGGQLARSEAIQNRWVRVGSWDLPSEITVTNASDAGLSVRSFKLTKHAVK